MIHNKLRKKTNESYYLHFVTTIFVVLFSLVAEGAAFLENKNHASILLSSRRQQQQQQQQQQQLAWSSTTTVLQMALTPVGPFCPFRSQAAVDVEPRMEQMNTAGPEFATEMSRISLDMQMGNDPDPDRLRRVAAGLNDAVDQWENLVARLRLSSDFQTREYAKLTQAHLDNHDVTIESVASMMRWQAGCMKAMADNTPPPMPPPDLDFEKLMQPPKETDAKPPSVTAMAAAEAITTTPFNGNEAIFDSPNVKEEYEKLCRDHNYLIEFGSKYDDFDPSGKLLFLDQIESIEERWDVFFARFQLMGQLNQDYIKQCQAFLESMNMNEDDYRKLLKKCHDTMRADAEQERARLGL